MGHCDVHAVGGAGLRSGHRHTLWVATRSSLRAVLENVTQADPARGALPRAVRGYIEQAGAWERR